MTTDHKAEAERILPKRGEGILPNHVAVAQVHATLYLAEQQRIANLIAAFAEGGLTSDVKHLGFKDWPEVLEHIRTGLGLA